MKKSFLRRLLLVLCFIGAASFIATATTEPGLTNISTRAFVQTGDNVVIGGFIIERAPPDFSPAPPKKVLIRAIGPDLVQYGIPNVLANPTLELHDGTGALIASNNNWATTIIGGIITASQVHEIQASGYAPGDPYDSAIIADLPAGSYTAIVRGINNMTGVALVEVYDLGADTSLVLGDLSTRGYVQTGDSVMIGGFTVAGSKPKGVILRAIGPELGKYGVPNTLADPMLELYDSTGALIASNDNWQHTTVGGIIADDQVGDILNSGLNPRDPNESVINATLVPGTYTAIVRGVNNTTGVALVEGHSTSATYTWTGAIDSHWENPANWEPNGVPEKGDFAAIGSGTSNSPAISVPVIDDVEITLGNSHGGSINLNASSVTFAEAGLTVTGRTLGLSPVNALLSCQGDVTFALAGKIEEKKGVNGIITVEAMGGRLTIDAGDGVFTLTNVGATDEPDTVACSNTNATPEFKALVTQESSLIFKGQKIVTKRVDTDQGTIVPIIQIEGAVEIVEGTTLAGDGILSVDSGGHLSIRGAVESCERIVFADHTGRVSIGNPTTFLGTLGFPEVPGARVNFPTIRAQSLRVDSLSHPQVLKLYAGPNPTGQPLADINVEAISQDSLLPSGLPLKGNDFVLSSDTKEGTLLTYLPTGTIQLQQSMPVPLIAPTDSKVPLQTIFAQSFGTSMPAFHSITLHSPKPQTNPPNDYKYWINAAPHRAFRGLAFTPAWFVNGKQILPGKARIVQPKDYGKVELLVGNNINNPARFDAQVTRATKGPESEIVTYSVWTVDPRVAKGVGSIPGKPTPDDSIAAAHSLQHVFPYVPNTNLCNWIADNVAAVAGAAVPLPDAEGDPTNNVQGGFWRIAYTGTGPQPVKDWFRLVRPGDFIRMRHLYGGFHTTTALSGQQPDGTITVYSNGGGFFIGIHPSTVDRSTDPASITIYRLDPKHQYLILGSSLGEVIQGSIYDNLVRPGGGSDIIVAGPANNEIQDTISNLDGIAVRNFHAGDVLNFTNLHPNETTVQYDATSAMLTVSRSNHPVATVKLPGLNANAQFSVTRNGDGTNITLLP